MEAKRFSLMVDIEPGADEENKNESPSRHVGDKVNSSLAYFILLTDTVGCEIYSCTNILFISVSLMHWSLIEIVELPRRWFFGVLISKNLFADLGIRSVFQSGEYLFVVVAALAVLSSTVKGL